MLIPSRKYTSSDSSKFEALVELSERLLHRSVITAPELLAGLRYAVPKETWEEWLEQARVMCESYVNYKVTDPEKNNAFYGE